MPTVALVGNPNTGKSTLFNALTGLRQRTGNYPGCTVELKRGNARLPKFGIDRDAGETTLVEIVDLPGTYSLSPRSPDEMLAVDLLLGRLADEPAPQAILSIVNAANLERHLYLTSQLLELGRPVVVALNMLDVAASHGINIDATRLAEGLGVPVVPIRADRAEGLDVLLSELAKAVAPNAPAPAKKPSFPEPLLAETAKLGELLAGSAPGSTARTPQSTPPEFLLRRILIDVGGHAQLAARSAAADPTAFDLALSEARERLRQANCAVPAFEPKLRYAWIRQAVTGVVSRAPVRPATWTDSLDAVLVHRIWGTLVFLLVMALVFQSIFTWAEPLMGLIESAQTRAADGVNSALPAGPLTSLITDGIIAGVGGVLVFLPQIIILFGFVAVLEDCGYMARAAFLMDRIMSRAGLSGKSFIPLLSSTACAIPGIMATRVIENSRDRLATILVAPLMSCSARLPVYALLISTFVPERVFVEVAGFKLVSQHGLVLFGMYMIGFVVAPLMAMVLKRTLLAGEVPVFVMELPVYRLPSVLGVARRMLEAGWSFVERAGTIILATMVLVWAALYFPRGEVGDTGRNYPDVIAELQDERDVIGESPASEEAARRADYLDEQINTLTTEWKSQSLLGRLGRAVEPTVRPLGWDWRLAMAAIASFPAREVVVGTLGVIYGVGDDVEAITITKDDAGDQLSPLGRKLAAARWEGTDRPIFTLPVAFGVMVFFALCAQCASTLAVIRRETNSWLWPAFTFGYMTTLAYLGAMVTFQLGTALGM